MSPQLWWHVARAGGLVAYGLLAASIIWGLAVSTRLLGRWPAPGWTLDLHRYLGGLALTFTGIHLAALLLDSYIQFDLLDLLVPFASTWRPGAVAWGVVAVYLLVAVQATSLARRRLPHRLWRRIHLAAFPLLVASTGHLLAAGVRPRQPRRRRHAHGHRRRHHLPAPVPAAPPIRIQPISTAQATGRALASSSRPWRQEPMAQDGHLRGRHDG